jgi:predicted TIM-barrel fold metal-dependent hydrolase
LIVDVFNHFYPRQYLDSLPRPLPGAVTWVSSTMKGITDERYRVNQMDRLGIDLQVLSLPIPTIDDLSVPLESFRKITMAANDGIAKMAERSHGRFRGIATVSLLRVGEAVDELERSVKELGLLGVQILSNVRGRPLDSPEFEPFYSKAEQLGCGIWIHPAYIRETYSWMNDDYNMNMMMGWGIDTALAMFRIFRGGVLERHPNLIIITHHMGTLIPLMGGRINGFVMGQGKGGAPPAPLKKAPLEYMKMFYVDTAEGMWGPALVLSHGFYGSDHMLFGTDLPWGDTARIMENIRSLNVSEEEKGMILGGNALRLLRIE